MPVALEPIRLPLVTASQLGGKDLPPGLLPCNLTTVQMFHRDIHQLPQLHVSMIFTLQSLNQTRCCINRRLWHNALTVGRIEKCPPTLKPAM